jgi:CubicO group peptidase (beta-lactamase class C family)
MDRALRKDFSTFLWKRNNMEKAKPLFQNCLLILTVLFATSSKGQSGVSPKLVETTKAEKIEELISLYSDYEDFNGSVLVAHQGEVVYKKGFGLANMEWGIPNKVNTKFQIASITKQFTAMLIMQLVAENKLDLHLPISSFLPDYPKENGDRITIHHLLTHSSGIVDRRFDEKKNRPEEMVRQFANDSLQFTPGERFEYSNSGYTLLGFLIEKVTGNPYSQVLKDKILTPLHMTSTGFYRHRRLIQNMSSGYNQGFGEYFNIDYSDESSAYAAGAIYSTVEDMFLWDQALYTDKLLPRKYMNLLFTRHIEASFGGYYGYGWELSKKPVGNTDTNIEAIGHSGTISGYCALFTRLPSSNSTIIFLNNTRRAHLNAMTKAITGILYNQGYDLPIKPLAKLMSETIKGEGIEKGIMFYKDHMDLEDYYISEEELIVAGYKLLQAGNATYAAAIFKLSTEVFPNKDNTYDSYAEALMELGENEAAIKNYEKSLLLNPENDNAVRMLYKLTGKEIKRVSLLKTEVTWGKEVFSFPLRFAKEIKYEGFEEAHFPRGWATETSSEFWSYAFVWHVEFIEELSAKELESNLQIYFDGLMISVNKEKDKTLPKASANLRKMIDVDAAIRFEGTIEVYDSFVTRERLLLNVKIEKKDCNGGKSLVLFKFSPKNFESDIWMALEEVKIMGDACDY